MKFQLTAVGLACAALLAACGGGNKQEDVGYAQSVSFTYPGGGVLAPEGETFATVPLHATASSKLPITFESTTPAICSVSGITLSLLKPGECSVTAHQIGGDGYEAASQRQIFNIPMRKTSITFRNLGALPLDANAESLVATSSEDFPIVFTTSTPTVCSVTGTTMQKLAEGLCTVTATTEASGEYAAATMIKTMPIGNISVPSITFLSGYKDENNTRENGKVVAKGGSSETGWACDGRCSAQAASDGSYLSATYIWDKVNPHLTDNVWWRVWSEVELFAPNTRGFAFGGNSTAGVRIDAQKALKFNLAQNKEWFDANDNWIELDIVLGHNNVKADGNDCNVRLRTNFRPTTWAATNYSIDLKNDLRVDDACGLNLSNSDIWNELQDHPIVMIKVASSAGNYKVQDPAPAPTPSYRTTITLTGPIIFE